MIRIGLAGLVLLTGTAQGSATAPTAPPTPSEIADRLLAEMRDMNGVPGMGAAVWDDGRIIWVGSAGRRDVERGLPVDRNTIFRFASVSKLLTATAVARLAEESRIDIDAPVQSALPYLGKDWPALTTRQLAAHVSGMPHYQAVDENRGGTHYPDARSAVAIFDGRPLLSAPGASYSYSSWGFTLLGALVEQRAGTAFPDYVGSRVTPGLAIATDATDGGNPNASRAYEFVERAPRAAAPHDFSYTWGGGGLGGTAEALATFGGRMTANQIVSAETFAWMRRPVLLADGTPAADDDYTVGFGWRGGLDREGNATAHHAGVAIGARSALLAWPDDGMAVSLLSNALWVSSIVESASMLAAPFREAPPSLIAADCPLTATSYSGEYDGKPIAGPARFERDASGLCVGTLSLGGALADFFGRGPQRSASELRLIGIDPGGRFARAALVTPYGLYDLRSEGNGRFKANFSAERSLAFSLSAGDPRP